jgi:hypothetical protein
LDWVIWQNFAWIPGVGVTLLAGLAISNWMVAVVMRYSSLLMMGI